MSKIVLISSELLIFFALCRFLFFLYKKYIIPFFSSLEVAESKENLELRLDIEQLESKLVENQLLHKQNVADLVFMKQKIELWVASQEVARNNMIIDEEYNFLQYQKKTKDKIRATVAERQISQVIQETKVRLKAFDFSEKSDLFFTSAVDFLKKNCEK